MRLPLAPLAATVLLLAGCASTPTADITRFNIGAPIPKDAIEVEAANAADANGLEWRSYADIVARELAAIGFARAGGAGPRSAYIAALSVQQTTRTGPPRSSGVSIGLGGASYGGGVGVGGGVTVPLGKRPSNELRENRLAVQIRRRSDSSVVWEGRAVQEVPADDAGASLGAAVPALAHALFADFPGANGKTIKVKLPR